MTTLRVHAASLAGASVTPKLRVHGASVTGTVIATPKLRLFKASLAGVQAVLLAPIPAQSAEPRATVSVTAAPASGTTTPDSYTWRQVSGPTVTLTGSGATRSFSAPSLMPGATALIVLGVKGTVSGADGPEVTVNIAVLPQTRWSWNGSAWVGGGHTTL